MKTYSETPGKKLTCEFIEPNEVSRAFDRFVSVCTDVVFVDHDNCFVLAYRVIDAARGWWWKGGSMRRGETIESSLFRLMKREIGFVPSGIEPLDTFFHIWDKRNEEPRDNGKHDLIFLHFVKVDEETIAKIRLDPKEYDQTRGFLRYNGSQDVRPVVRDMYRKFRYSMP